MDENEKHLRNVFKTLFRLEEKDISAAEMHNTGEWDSLSHVSLMLEIEGIISPAKIDDDSFIELTTFRKCLDFVKTCTINND